MIRKVNEQDLKVLNEIYNNANKKNYFIKSFRMSYFS